jgi:hypothetical protein
LTSINLEVRLEYQDASALVGGGVPAQVWEGAGAGGDLAGQVEVVPHLYLDGLDGVGDQLARILSPIGERGRGSQKPLIALGRFLAVN